MSSTLSRALLGTYLAMACRCVAHPASPSPGIAPVPATASDPQAQSEALLLWESNGSSILCRATGTTLGVPASLRGSMRRSRPDEIVLSPPGTPALAAILVKTARNGDVVSDFLADWATLHHDVTSHLLENATIRGEVRMDGHHIVVQYVASGQEPAQAYELAYTVIRRNGSSCRVLALQRAPVDPSSNLNAVLDSIGDAPGLDLFGAGALDPQEDPSWALLRGLMNLGAHVVFGRLD